MSGIERDLEEALIRAHRQALIDAVRNHPTTTLDELIGFARGRNRHLAGVTVSELVGGGAAVRSRPLAAASAAPPAAVRTRTLRQRADYDQAMLSTLEMSGRDMSASELRGALGGTPMQARAALNRLIEAGKVAFKGRARGTRYRSGR